MSGSCEIKTLGWGILCGLTVVLCLLLFVSECRMVSHRRALRTFMNDYEPVSCTPVDKNQGKLIHVDCPLEHLDTLYAASEFRRNVEDFVGVFTEVRVEMFQWVRKVGVLGPYYTGEFSGELVNSPEYPFFFFNQYKNPTFFPSVAGQGRKYTSRIYAGGFSIPESGLKLAFSSIRQLPLIDDGTYAPPETRPPLFVDYSNTNVHHNALYTGDPHNPQVGDLRITFWGSAATHTSVMGKQDWYDFDYSITGYPNPDNRNQTTMLYAEGDYSPEELLTHALGEADGSSLIICLLRGLAFLLMWSFLLTTCTSCSDCGKECWVVVTCSALCSGFLISVLLGPLWVLCNIIVGAILFALGGLCLVLAVTLWTLTKGGIRGEGSSGNNSGANRSGIVRWSTAPPWRQDSAPLVSKS